MQARRAMTIPLTSFQELVRTKYLAAGFNQERWTAKVMIDTGISRHALCAAYKGTRVAPATARALTIWATKTFFVDLDELALMHAPTRKTRAKRVQPAQDVPC